MFFMYILNFLLQIHLCTYMQAHSLHHSFSNVGSELGGGLDINTSDVTLELHKEFADVSRTFTFPKRMNPCLP